MRVLFTMVLRLAERVQLALDLLESYFYESESRELWKSEGRHILEPAFGVSWPSTINAVQKYWILYNTMEDERENREHQWTMVKFMVGPHAPKGIKKLSDKDRERERELRERRAKIQDRTFWEALGVIPKLRGKDREMSIREVRKAETFEELQEEMKNWVRGNLDDHDRIVESVKNRIRDEVQAREQMEIDRAEALRVAMEEESNRNVGKPEILRTLTPEEMDRFMRPQPVQVYYGEGRNSAYEKYLATKTILPGNLEARGDTVAPTVPIDMSRLNQLLSEENGPKEDSSSLQEVLNHRIPRMDR